MGATQSQPSYRRYKNDFELVIRATKDLEHLLETQFGAPSGKKDGLHDKITYAEQEANLSADTVKKMRYLVTLRNKLVHEHGFNSLPDREGFAHSYDQVAKELREKIVKRKGGVGDPCIIS